MDDFGAIGQKAVFPRGMDGRLFGSRTLKWHARSSGLAELADSCYHAPGECHPGDDFGICGYQRCIERPTR